MLVVAAPAEVRAVLTGLGSANSVEPWKAARLTAEFDIVQTGIGKANAAGAVGIAADPEHHRAILNVGIAGSLPGSQLGLRDVVIASGSLFSDEGVQTPERFIPCHEMGFPIGDFQGATVPTAESINHWLSAALLPLSPVIGTIATVSTCSGTNVRAESVRSTGAICECMEGAAAALVARKLGLPFGEVRVISNTTGDRPGQIWDISGALATLSRVIGLLGQPGSP